MTELGQSRTLGIGTSFLSKGVPVQLTLMTCLFFQVILIQCCIEDLSKISKKLGYGLHNSVAVLEI